MNRQKNERRKKNCESFYTNKIDDKQSNAQKKYDQERKKIIIVYMRFV